MHSVLSVLFVGLLIAACGKSNNSRESRVLPKVAETSENDPFPGFIETSEYDSKPVTQIPAGSIFILNRDLFVSKNSPQWTDFGLDFADRDNDWYYGRKIGGVCYLTTNASLKAEYILKSGSKLELATNWYDQRGGESEAIERELQQLLHLGFNYDGNRLLEKKDGMVTFSVMCTYDIKNTRHSFRIGELKEHFAPTMRILFPDPTILK
jgi:hypothetical protein